MSLTCQLCGKEFRRPPSRANNKFCSHACYWEAKLTTEQLFWKYVGRKTPTGCILWEGSFDSHGYGRTWTRDDKHARAHRIAYILMVGPVPDDLFVLHHCDNPPCVNPVHLFLGSNQDNVDDMVSKRRHYHGERHHSRKLDKKKVIEIRRLYALGERNQYELAEDFGVQHSSISDIINKKTWKFV